VFFGNVFRQFFDPDLSKVSAKKHIDCAMALIEAEILSNSHSAKSPFDRLQSVGIEKEKGSCAGKR